MTGKRKAIQQRRKIDQDLENQFRFLQSVIAGARDPILVIGTDFRVKLHNSATQVFHDLKQAPEKNMYCYQLMLGLEKPCALSGRACPLVDVLEFGKAVRVEHKQKLADGKIRFFEILASPLEDEDGELLGIIETFRDITERKQAQKKLQMAHIESERKVKERTAELVATIETLRREIQDREWAENELLKAKERDELLNRVTPSAIFSVDLEQNITSWNAKAEAVTGFRSEEVIGKHCSIFALDPCTKRCGVYSTEITKPIVSKECKIKTKDGDVRIVSKNADLLIDTDGQVIGAVESFEDITKLKQVAEELQAERDKFSVMLSAMEQGMHIVTRDFVIEYQNDILKKAFGDRIGRKCYEVYKERDEPCDICRMLEAVDTMEMQHTEATMGNNRYYKQSYAPFTDIDGEKKTLILLTDITEEKMHEAETLRAGQLASLGELAAGVAHEINNPINGIINFAQLLHDDAHNELELDLSGRVIKEGKRVADIVKNLLLFSRQHDIDPEDIIVSSVIEESLNLVQHQLVKDGIQVQSDFQEGLPFVFANPKQLQQVFLNLLSNARYALNQKYPGANPEKAIAIKTERVSLEGKDYVRTTVTDWGSGIPKEIIENIFDPFFSSKKPGDGTGLGLSISHGLIKDFNGHLHVDSDVGEFTTMIVDLPAS